MGLSEDVSRLIGRIYESAHDNEQWDSMLEDVRQRLEVRCLFQSISRLNCLEMQRGVVLALVLAALVGGALAFAGPILVALR